MSTAIYQGPCPDCGSSASTMHENGAVQVCDNCTFILWEDLD